MKYIIALIVRSKADGGEKYQLSDFLFCEGVNENFRLFHISDFFRQKVFYVALAESIIADDLDDLQKVIRVGGLAAALLIIRDKFFDVRGR